jgi:hypothetical protein
MTILTVIRAFCQRTGLPAPGFVAASQDAQVVQLLALANEVIEDLVDRWTWQDLVKEATFVTIAGEDQGAIATIAPSGFSRILQETIFNRTLRLPLFGPLAASQWQGLKALPNPGPNYQYRIRGGRLLFSPAGVVGQTCAFEYASRNAAIGADSIAKPAFTLDTDNFLLPESLLMAGLRWKWKAEKGLDYAEEFRRYEILANNAAGRDGTKPRLAMDGGCASAVPGIFVPAGNWNVP